MNRPHLKVIAGRPVTVQAPPPPPRHPPGHDLEWLLGPIFIASGFLLGWLVFAGLEYLPW